MKNVVSVLVLLLALPLAGCVYADADFVQNAGQTTILPSHEVAPEAVQVLTGDLTDRPYQVLGEVTATAFILNNLVSDPVPADVDQALREAAARHGADAVLMVTYRSGRQGLRARGHLSATGKAVRFL